MHQYVFISLKKIDFFTNAKLANEGHKFLGLMILLLTNKVGNIFEFYTFKNNCSNVHS